MVDQLSPTVSVIIPAFNEADEIASIVRRVRDIGPDFEIIVVDDGSSDETGARAAEAGARVLRHPYNIGNGASVKHGCLEARGDVIVMMDGDGQHPPEIIPRLLARLDEYDLVVAARTRKSSTDPVRNLGNRMLILVAEWISGRQIADLTSGFRAIKREMLMEFIHLFPQRYSYPTTITLAMLQSGHFVAYEPADEIRHRESGSSNISPAVDFFRFINIIFRIIMLFSPQRLFVPVGGVLFLLGIVISTFQLIYHGGVFGAGLVTLLSSVSIACFGLLADQIAMLRRDKRK